MNAPDNNSERCTPPHSHSISGPRPELDDLDVSARPRKLSRDLSSNQFCKRGSPRPGNEFERLFEPVRVPPTPTFLDFTSEWTERRRWDIEKAPMNAQPDLHEYSDATSSGHQLVVPLTARVHFFRPHSWRYRAVRPLLGSSASMLQALCAMGWLSAGFAFYLWWRTAYPSTLPVAAEHHNGTTRKQSGVVTQPQGGLIPDLAPEISTGEAGQARATEEEREGSVQRLEPVVHTRPPVVWPTHKIFVEPKVPNPSRDPVELPQPPDLSVLLAASPALPSPAILSIIKNTSVPPPTTPKSSNRFKRAVRALVGEPSNSDAARSARKENPGQGK
jgi:hypothetical protein